MGFVTAAGAARALLAAHAAGRTLVSVALVEAADPAAAGRRLLVDEDGGVEGSLGDPTLDARAAELGRGLIETGGAAAEAVELDGRRHLLYAEAHLPPEELVVVGAGHIAVPLARLGAMLGFRVTVLDDREEFATEERFPDAARVLRADFEGDPFAGVRLGRRSYVVLVTRGHRYDFDCLRRLVDEGIRPRYVGMIGSRRRVRAAFGALLKAGIARERLAAVHAPVGLAIGAETPEEIAVSIAAELVAVRRGADLAAGDGAPPGTGQDGGAEAAPAAARAPSLTERERVLARLLPEERERSGG